ncbi:hypothetical protein [Robiginitalea biformata]|uniref:LysM domain protein n=2 Tax=Flavobacteriaceae TaxID=49546 RepID=A4CLX0_ROBBH|nr:hypothetical protein [Robiginitalea biformata]EAR15869.1 hypothetical protein RB2501_16114 [Robiginitalea biformata HTCC2501]
MIFVLASFDADSPLDNVRVPESLIATDSLPQLQPVPEMEFRAQRRPGGIPFPGSSYIGFREALAFKESGGDYFTTNTLGYLGKYQFGIGTLQLMGVYNAATFLSNPELQEKAFATNLARNKWILRRDIPRFAGKRINGVEVTESGILAAAHLAGAGNVKKYLRSGGSYEAVDAYGTSITNYLRKFRGYDMSGILPEKNPKVDF